MGRFYTQRLAFGVHRRPGAAGALGGHGHQHHADCCRHRACWLSLGPGHEGAISYCAKHIAHHTRDGSFALNRAVALSSGVYRGLCALLLAACSLVRPPSSIGALTDVAKLLVYAQSAVACVLWVCVFRSDTIIGRAVARLWSYRYGPNCHELIPGFVVVSAGRVLRGRVCSFAEQRVSVFTGRRLLVSAPPQTFRSSSAYVQQLLRADGVPVSFDRRRYTQVTIWLDAKTPRGFNKYRALRALERGRTDGSAARVRKRFTQRRDWSPHTTSACVHA